MATKHNHTTVVALPSKKTIGVRRNNISLVNAPFGKWIEESNQLIATVIDQSKLTSPPATAFPRFVSQHEADIMHFLFVEPSIVTEEVVQNIANQEPSNGLTVQLSEIPSGEYAYHRYIGPYDALPKVWHQVEQDIKEQLLEFKAAEPCWEEYLNSPCTVKPEELITDIYWKLVKKDHQ